MLYYFCIIIYYSLYNLPLYIFAHNICLLHVYILSCHFLCFLIIIFLSAYIFSSVYSLLDFLIDICLLPVCILFCHFLEAFVHDFSWCIFLFLCIIYLYFLLYIFIFPACNFLEFLFMNFCSCVYFFSSFNSSRFSLINASLLPAFILSCHFLEFLFACFLPVFPCILKFVVFIVIFPRNFVYCLLLSYGVII